MKLLVINGPNLNMLGIREPDIYGKNTYEELVRLIEKTCEQKGIEVEIYQSNTEGFNKSCSLYPYQHCHT